MKKIHRNNLIFRYALIIFSVVIIGSLIGCNSGSTNDTETDDNVSTAADYTPKVDPEIIAILETFTKNDKCTFDLERLSMRGCTDESRERGYDLKEKPVKNLYDTFFAILKPLDEATEEEKKLVAIAAIMVNSAFSGHNGLGKDAVSKEQARFVLDTFSKLPPAMAKKAVVPVILAGTMAGMANQVSKTLDSHPASDDFTFAYKHYLTFGRLDALPIVQKLAAEGNKNKTIFSLEAARNIYKLNEQEKQQICEWAKGYLSQDDIDIATVAAEVLIHPCGGSYIDQVLDEAEKRNQANQVDREFILMLRNICSSFAGEATAGQKEQCKRNFDILESITNNESYEDFLRGLALDAIYMQQRTEDTIPIMQKYVDHPVEDVKNAAKDAIESIKSR
jgi:hypothetical protein